jgi:O-antigen/teichoic acid export membrane protein
VKVVLDKEVELQKIQILESNFRGWHNFILSILSGTLIGFFVLLATMYYEGLINYYAFILGLVTVLVFIILWARNIQKTNSKHLRQLDDLIQKVENGEPLPSLNQLLKNSR